MGSRRRKRQERVDHNTSEDNGATPSRACGEDGNGCEKEPHSGERQCVEQRLGERRRLSFTDQIRPTTLLRPDKGKGDPADDRYEPDTGGRWLGRHVTS